MKIIIGKKSNICSATTLCNTKDFRISHNSKEYWVSNNYISVHLNIEKIHRVGLKISKLIDNKKIETLNDFLYETLFKFVDKKELSNIIRELSEQKYYEGSCAKESEIKQKFRDLIGV